jgi:hypothetical protein
MNLPITFGSLNIDSSNPWAPDSIPFLCPLEYPTSISLSFHYIDLSHIWLNSVLHFKNFYIYNYYNWNCFISTSESSLLPYSKATDICMLIVSSCLLPSFISSNIFDGVFKIVST